MQNAEATPALRVYSMWHHTGWDIHNRMPHRTGIPHRMGALESKGFLRIIRLQIIYDL